MTNRLSVAEWDQSRISFSTERCAQLSNINLGKQHPAVYKQLAALSAGADESAHASGLDPKLVELVKIRVSQINGCAFCLRMHTRDALKQGETTDRLAVLVAWRESQYFSAAEMAALELAEDTTQLTCAGPRVDTSALTSEQVSAVQWIIIAMNAWNRVAIQSGYSVAP